SDDPSEPDTPSDDPSDPSEPDTPSEKHWVEENGNWYYTDDSGDRVTGKQTIDGKDYYFDETGLMQTDWIFDNGWYYANSDGALQKGWLKTTDGNAVEGGCWYKLDSETGLLQTGWIYWNNYWYYLRPDFGGATAMGLVKIQDGNSTEGGLHYYLRPELDGALLEEGWVYLDGEWYYAKSDWTGGMAQNEWVLLDAWYCFDENSKMLKNTTTPDGYYVDENGRWVS
ncbi:MAG: hypothetical protein Q4B14_02545, partial [Clostridia bacterium]|nr:hypothetical protein [Clostridia bacterium]